MVNIKGLSVNSKVVFIIISSAFQPCWFHLPNTYGFQSDESFFFNLFFEIIKWWGALGVKFRKRKRKGKMVNHGWYLSTQKKTTQAANKTLGEEGRRWGRRRKAWHRSGNPGRKGYHGRTHRGTTKKQASVKKK